MEITNVMEAAVALLMAIVSYFLIPWIRGKIGEQKMSELMRWIRIAVAATDQVLQGVDGETKNINTMKILEEKGIDTTDPGVISMVEAEVLRQHGNPALKGTVVGNGT